jgi:HK97 family phage major capsid protein
VKIKFVKNYLSYKTGDVAEVGDESADLIAKGYAEEVKVNPVDEIVNDLEKRVSEVAEKVASETAVKTVEKVSKALSAKKSSIYVGADAVESDPKKGFKHFGDFVTSVMKAAKGDGEAQTRLKATASGGMSVGTDADGGYAVPDIWANSIFTTSMSGPNLYDYVTKLPMSGPGSTLKIPAELFSTIGSNGFAAQSKTRAQDGTSITTSKAGLREMSIDVNRLVILAPLTDDLLNDSIALGAYIEKKAGDELNYKLNSNILRGGTVATGILGHASAVTVLRNTASRVKFADIKNMWTRRYGRNFVWIINQEVEADLFDLSDAANRNIYFPPGGIKDSPYGTILGAPVIVSEHASSLGDEGDVVLADLSQYLTVNKGGVERATSAHLYFDTAEQAFRWTLRVGGRPGHDSVITPASGQGTKTRSPFVVLDNATT